MLSYILHDSFYNIIYIKMRKNNKFNIIIYNLRILIVVEDLYKHYV